MLVQGAQYRETRVECQITSVGINRNRWRAGDRSGNQPSGEVAPVVDASGEDHRPLRTMEDVLTKPAERALASAAGAGAFGAGEKEVVAPSDHFIQIHTADEGLTLAEEVRPLRSATDYLL